MAESNIDITQKFTFLHSHVAREAHIYEVLAEIQSFQDKVLKTGIGTLATLDDMKTSRNIKIPFSTTRNKTIINLLDILTKNYPEEIRTIVSFNFKIEPSSKKLSIQEKKEYTVLISNDELNRLQAERNEKSAENLLQLLSQFRLFNLTKLVKQTKERVLLSKIIKLQLGISIFTFKSFSLDRQNIEIAEDYCFHKNNYEAVKGIISTEKIKKIIETHAVQINRRLQKFGILNADFTDYTDTKLDYLLNIILEDIPSSLTAKELTEVKNFNSLRSCLTKVDNIIDPIITASNDIAQYIIDNGICKSSEIIAVFPDLNIDMMRKWYEENKERFKIHCYTDESHATYYISGPYLINNIKILQNQIINDPGKFSQLEHTVKQKKIEEFDLLANSGRALLSSEDRSKKILVSDDNIQQLKQVIDDYDDYKRSMTARSSIAEEEQAEFIGRRTILGAIIGFFRSLFTDKKLEAGRQSDRIYSSADSKSYRAPVYVETKDIFNSVKISSAKILALSNFLEIIPANDKKIENLINDLRRFNTKIVIPIFNARKKLYPVRSQHYLISDVEYLLVNPDIIQSPEAIRDFTDSLPGEKIKEETIPPSAILTVEKYLLSLHRQKKAQFLKKNKSRKKS